MEKLILVTILHTLLITLVSCQFGALLGKVQDTVLAPVGKSVSVVAAPVEKTVSAVYTPVGKTVVAVALKKCDVLKTLLGVSIDQLLDKSEPDVSKLKLDLWKGDGRIIYNLTDCAKRILESRKIDLNQPVVIFLHGFLSSSESEGPLEVTKALTSTGLQNVMALDSSSLIRFFYLRSSTCVRFVGAALGNALVDLYKGGVDPKKIHIIGHSLGSHIAGFAGKTFREQTGQKIGRITGLDPAGPCFFREHPELRLNHEDADFVDVIHTDGGILGLMEPLGHVDFYPNSGEEQPGCAITPCSHSRAWELFAESILNPKTFSSVKCPGWDTFKSDGCSNSDRTNMGLGADSSKRGTFYLKTNRIKPFEIRDKGPTNKGNFGF